MTEEVLIVETPEHIELHFALASIGNRWLACAVDHVLQMLALALVSTLGYALGISVPSWEASGLAEAQPWLAAALIVLGFLIFFGYFTFFETLWNGQTPGKRWLQLRVIQTDGRPIDFVAACGRNVLRLADMLPPPFYSLGLITMFVTPRAQRLGDLLADTVVIKERSFEAPTFEEVFGDGPPDTALRRVAPAVDFHCELRAVTADEWQVVKHFLRRRHDLPAQTRARLAERIAAPLLEKLQPEYASEQFNCEGFLEELFARHYAALAGKRYGERERPAPCRGA